ncbi:MAG TPA: M4 family metallopeptidase, partial [Thermoanaerobaculia bacterium]
MKRSLAAMVFLVATVAFAKDPVNDSHVKIKDSDERGVPTFVTGELGQLAPGSAAQSAKAFLKTQKALLKMQGTEDFDVLSSSKDSLGQTHVKMRQTLRGLPVVGAEYIVHADAAGKVFAMNGRFAPDLDLPRNPSVDAIGAINRAAAQLGAANAKITDRPTLTYVVNERSNAFLAWTALVEYTNADGYQLDRVYADATTGDLVLDAPTIHRARSRATYNVNNGTTLPGTLVMSETSAPSSDVSIAKAHEYAGVTYDYYFGVHSRDSYNNAGAQLRSSVHYSSGYNNAFWNGAQMVYGDGDGSEFGPFSRALDVVAHELSHAVTETSANLTYSYESGALNEATSDIMGVAAEAWKYGVIDSRTWKVGEDCYTPATAGDALRYMNDPKKDGSSIDYYTDYYSGLDVHYSSGLGNLAFYLLSNGG